MCPQKKKFSGLRSSERGGKAAGSPRPIHRAGYVAFKKCRTVLGKWAPSCINHVSPNGERNSLQQTEKHLFQEDTPIRCAGQTVWQDVRAYHVITKDFCPNVHGKCLLVLTRGSAVHLTLFCLSEWNATLCSMVIIAHLDGYYHPFYFIKTI
ncbi:hypothetical protein AVEN_214451-1 [Araneus ventricosus]|uniref:Uncharacterized protein n=1 Tax=Araneus ventricosus TaxID=182803 RepID=A0A4Y2NGT3_ARAVE|nr:hypothetical protein AVEN_214451-1 [Araneus ventricosus]